MKAFSKILILLATLYCSQGIAGEVGMAFVGETIVNGNMEHSDQGAEFTGTSENSKDVYTKVKKALENGFSGFVDATLIDHETGKETEIVLVADDLNEAAIVAFANDKVVFFWRSASN